MLCDLLCDWRVVSLLTVAVLLKALGMFLDWKFAPFASQPPTLVSRAARFDPATPEVVLVTGATGTAGRNIVRQLVKSSSVKRVIAVSRRTDPTDPVMRHEKVVVVPADLLDARALKQALQAVEPVSVVFQAAAVTMDSGHPTELFDITQRRYLPLVQRVCRFLSFVPGLSQFLFYQFNLHGQAVDPQHLNAQMLANVVNVLTQPPHCLRHVGVVTGGKQHGVHLGPLWREWHSVITEASPCPPGPNFYYDLELYLQQLPALSKHTISWNTARPHAIIGSSKNTPHNLLTALAVYASIAKHLGMKLAFPGNGASWNSLSTLSDARLIGDLLLWASRTPAAHNQGLLCVNGGSFRWRDLWPQVAAYFNLEWCLAPSPDGFSVAEFLLANRAVWDEQVVPKHRLAPVPLIELCTPVFVDKFFSMLYSVEYDMSKARGMGFEGRIDDFTCLREHWEEMVAMKLIPSPQS